MSFALTFSWRRFVLAMWNRDCPNKNKNAIFAFGVPTKNFAHEMLPPELGRVYLSFDHVSHCRLQSPHTRVRHDDSSLFAALEARPFSRQSATAHQRFSDVCRNDELH